MGCNGDFAIRKNVLVLILFLLMGCLWCGKTMSWMQLWFCYKEKCSAPWGSSCNNFCSTCWILLMIGLLYMIIFKAIQMFRCKWQLITPLLKFNIKAILENWGVLGCNHVRFEEYETQLEFPRWGAAKKVCELEKVLKSLKLSTSFVMAPHPWNIWLEKWGGPS